MLFHVPRPQGVSTVDPFVSTKCPTLAFMQLDWPTWSCQVPIEHGVGADAPGPEKLPAGTLPQSAEELDPLLGLYVPASQGVCVVDPFVST